MATCLRRSIVFKQAGGGAGPARGSQRQQQRASESLSWPSCETGPAALRVGARLASSGAALAGRNGSIRWWRRRLTKKQVHRSRENRRMVRADDSARGQAERPAYAPSAKLICSRPFFALAALQFVRFVQFAHLHPNRDARKGRRGWPLRPATSRTSQQVVAGRPSESEPATRP
jgi:hypothetical protein